MSAFQHLNLDELADSPYAQALRRGVTTRAFVPRLEALYVEEHLVRMRSRVRIWFLLTALISLLYIAEKVTDNGWLHPQTLLQLCVIFPAAVWLTCLSYSDAYRERYLPAARVLVPAIQVAVAAFVAGEVAAGSPLDLGGVVISIVGLFIFSGLLFRRTVAVLCAVTLVFLGAALANGMASAAIVHSLLTLMLSGVLAAFACSDIELAYRRDFLKGMLIGELAERDGLTSLRNRRAFDAHLQTLWKQAAREETAFSILMIDLDFFKAFNDTYGHPAGDRALKGTAEIVLHAARRPFDLAARYGGEELVLVLHGVDEQDAWGLAETLRAAVQALNISHTAGTVAGACTVSIGVAVARPWLEEGPAMALQRADDALYQAKRLGRNRVVMQVQGEPDRTAQHLNTAAPSARTGGAVETDA